MEALTTQINAEDLMNTLGNYLGTTRFWISLAIVIAGVIIWQVFKRLRQKWQEKNGNSPSTFSHVAFDLFRFVFIFFLIIVLLQINGINVTSMMTGLGIVSVIVAFALQDFLKDIVMGIHILTDNFFAVGDVVRYGDIEGVVISFNIRTTKLKSVKYNEIITISNRNISEIQVLSDMFDLDVNLPYYVEAKKIHETMLAIAEKASREVEGISTCVYKGPDSFNESSISYKLRYWTPPDSRRFDVRRALVRIVQDSLGEAGIPFPYNHLDVELVDKKQQTQI